MYEYSKGFNLRALVALVAGLFCALIGLVVPALRFLYDCAWFIGFFLSAAVYYLFMRSQIGTATHSWRGNKL
jgi:NCS1 family nucleobase:cation symporter-1